jgi:dephospho-CoA kinase
VHELYEDPEVRAAVVERWGQELAPAGVVDRHAVARRAFASPAERAWLEALLWPKVGERIARWRAVESEREPRALVVEVPLLFESGMEAAFDYTIAVVADEAVRAERAGRRGHAAVAERTGRQLPQEEKSQRADFTVRNEGTIEELKQSLSNVLEKIERHT